MRHDKLESQLNLLLLLTENHRYTAVEICEKMGISRRNFYYYLDFFRDAGFVVENHRPYYRIDKDSPFFRKLFETIHFTEDEAITLRRILDRIGDDDLQVRRLRQKLDKLYDLDILNNPQMREQMAHNVSSLYEAIKQKRCVMLKGYSSPHSNTERDRIVEPFLFMNGNNEIRCYEPSSAMNKTFKISRMQEVVLLDLLWENEAQHRQLYTDIFMFSDEQQLPISLRMGRLSSRLLTEEYPQAERYVVQEDASHWRLEVDVCSYVGIGRFVLGLFDDIEVLGDDGFRKYLAGKIDNMKTATA